MPNESGGPEGHTAYLNGRFAPPEQVDYKADEYWAKRRLCPTHLLVHDVVLQPGSSEASTAPTMLETQEKLSSSFLPALKMRHWLATNLKPDSMTPNRQERLQLKSMVTEYGWMNALRLEKNELSPSDSGAVTKCRHISSKFSEYIQGALLALTDAESPPNASMFAFRELENCIHQNERFSKHGRYFTPFFQSLSHDPAPDHPYPLLLSVPFLDWSVDGPPPPLRFQVDPREGYQSGRSSAHLLRSILEHFYRLEDTMDREHKQVFNRHKPWSTDRNLDLKVRRWYGHYPQALNVDELWILAVDERHVVTFSSNQSWKSRWPPLQLASRIAEVSFRGIRNSLLLSERSHEYTALTHLVACLSGAVGILHRSFWADIPLCLTDRYAGYLSHLQYRLYRSPSTKLVMDLLQVQEELNIIIQVTQQQSDLIADVQDAWFQQRDPVVDRMSVRSRAQSHVSTSAYQTSAVKMLAFPDYPTFRQPSSSTLSDPMSQLVENLQRELADMRDLRDNTNNLVNRTIQLVNIRLEDHGKAILVFTIVTIVFLPLSFVSSFFGMNVSDIRNLEQTQWLFWAVAGALTVAVVSFAIFLAFYGGRIYETFIGWKDERQRMRRNRTDRSKMPETIQRDIRNFKVLDASRSDKWSMF